MTWQFLWGRNLTVAQLGADKDSLPAQPLVRPQNLLLGQLCPSLSNLIAAGTRLGGLYQNPTLDTWSSSTPEGPSVYLCPRSMSDHWPAFSRDRLLGSSRERRPLRFLPGWFPSPGPPCSLSGNLHLPAAFAAGPGRSPP